MNSKSKGLREQWKSPKLSHGKCLLKHRSGATPRLCLCVAPPPHNPSHSPHPIPNAMSTSELPIDPSLRDPPPQPPPSRSPRKRKARASISAPRPSPRVTRRAAALAGNGQESGEPSRGEEENLIRYAWGRGDSVGCSASCPACRVVIRPASLRKWSSLSGCFFASFLEVFG